MERKESQQGALNKLFPLISFFLLVFFASPVFGRDFNPLLKDKSPFLMVGKIDLGKVISGLQEESLLKGPLGKTLSFLKLENFTISAKSSLSTDCSKNSQIISGAVAMYNMDLSGKMKTLDLNDLVKGGYLRTLPLCGEGGTYQGEDLSETGRVTCSLHQNGGGTTKGTPKNPSLPGLTFLDLWVAFFKDLDKIPLSRLTFFYSVEGEIALECEPISGHNWKGPFPEKKKFFKNTLEILDKSQFHEPGIQSLRPLYKLIKGLSNPDSTGLCTFFGARFSNMDWNGNFYFFWKKRGFPSLEGGGIPWKSVTGFLNSIEKLTGGIAIHHGIFQKVFSKLTTQSRELSQIGSEIPPNDQKKGETFYSIRTILMKWGSTSTLLEFTVFEGADMEKRLGEVSSLFTETPSGFPILETFHKGSPEEKVQFQETLKALKGSLSRPPREKKGKEKLSFQFDDPLTFFKSLIYFGSIIWLENKFFTEVIPGAGALMVLPRSCSLNRNLFTLILFRHELEHGKVGEDWLSIVTKHPQVWGNLTCSKKGSFTLLRDKEGDLSGIQCSEHRVE